MTVKVTVQRGRGREGAKGRLGPDITSYRQRPGRLKEDPVSVLKS
jgi:hypothetical protein